MVSPMEEGLERIFLTNRLSASRTEVGGFSEVFRSIFSLASDFLGEFVCLFSYYEGDLGQRY